MESVGASPELLERRLLTRALEVRENETSQHGRRAEARQVMLRQAVAPARFGHERHLLVHVLAGTLLNEPGDEEHVARLGRLIVLQDPALEVLERLIARTSIRRMILEGEALADAPDNRTGVAAVGGLLAPLDGVFLESLRHVLVRDGNEVRILDFFGHQHSGQLLELLGVIHQCGELLLVEVAEEI